jgi:endonuclease YncB( thermonuclease family)
MNRIVVVVSALLFFVAGAQAGTKAKKAKAPPEPTELVGEVSRIVDGDTLWLRTAADSEPVVIRIEGIDAPERCQAGGDEATQALTRLALNRNVTVRIATRDDYARIVGKVFDGATDIGDRMVRDGHAWSARYKYDRGPYVAEERMAVALRRGVHGEAGAVMPREFRQRHGPCENGPAPSAAPATQHSAASTVATASTSGNYSCDGRTYCSQMTSCEEATWFVQHCPGVKMDGNRDGVPCEKQWCRAR